MLKSSTERPVLISSCFGQPAFLKRCSTCREYKPSDKFYRKRANKCGLDNQCKVCKDATNMRYRKTAKGKAMRQRESIKVRQTLSGYLHTVVSNIQSRCYNKDAPDYRWYGGKGVLLCFTMPTLRQWILKNKIEPRGKHIHRINPNGHYALNNIEFLTTLKHKEKHVKRKC